MWETRWWNLSYKTSNYWPRATSVVPPVPPPNTSGLVLGFFDTLALGTQEMHVIRQSKGWKEKENCDERFPRIIRVCDI